MPLIQLTDLNDPRLAPFSRMTDAELRDPHQMVGLARAINARNAGHENSVRAPVENSTIAADDEAAAVSTPAICDQSSVERLANGLFIGESKNVIERALAAGIKPFALLVEECWHAASAALIERLLAADPSLPVFIAPRSQMHELTGFERTRGALAAFHRPPLPRVEDLLAHARRVAVLEDITNYTNIGAIFRSAAALGIDAVLVTPSCHDPYYRRAARVSMGTVFQVPWTRIGEEPAQTANAEFGSVTQAACAARERESAALPTHTADPANWADHGIPLLRAHGFTTCALALTDNSIPLQDRRLQELDKIALVLGTEGDGLAAHTIAQCDFTVRIPMDHDVDSLNVAAASAVAFWELRTKHRE